MRPREIERDVLLIGSEVEVAGDELAALINLNGPWETVLAAHPLEHLDDVRRPETKLPDDRPREAREGVDNDKDPQLAARDKLVVHEIHCPGLVDCDGASTTILTAFVTVGPGAWRGPG